MTAELESHMRSMKNLATGLVSDPKKEERGGLSIDKKSPSLERDVLQRLGIDSITAPVTSIAFTNHPVSHVSPVEPLFSQYSFVI